MASVLLPSVTAQADAGKTVFVSPKAALASESTETLAAAGEAETSPKEAGTVEVLVPTVEQALEAKPVSPAIIVSVGSPGASDAGAGPLELSSGAVSCSFTSDFKDFFLSLGKLPAGSGGGGGILSSSEIIYSRCTVS